MSDENELRGDLKTVLSWVRRNVVEEEMGNEVLQDMESKRCKALMHF